MMYRTLTFVMISHFALLLLCVVAATAEDDTAPSSGSTISHKVRMTYTSPEDRDAKLQALLARWKSILEQPDIGRTATGIQVSRETSSIITYDVTYKKTDKQAPAVSKKKVTDAVEKSLGQQPIAGVFSAANTRSRGIIPGSGMMLDDN